MPGLAETGLSGGDTAATQLSHIIPVYEHFISFYKGRVRPAKTQRFPVTSASPAPESCKNRWYSEYSRQFPRCAEQISLANKIESKTMFG